MTFDEVLDMTPMQIKAVYVGIGKVHNRNIRALADLLGVKVREPTRPKNRETTDATRELEVRLQQAKERTGRASFSLQELYGV